MFRAFTFPLALTLLFVPATAGAAVLSIIPESPQAGVGGEVVARVVIDSEDESVNAAEATIEFPTNILEVIEVDDGNSIFNFWVEGPSFSNESGTVRFIGGTPNSVSGGELSVLRIVFSARGAGDAVLSATDAVVTAADGKGTNVLRSIEEANVSVATDVVAAQPQPRGSQAEESPVVLERSATQAAAVPEAPEVRVPLYPDAEAWHNHTGETTVLWDVPDDITKVAFALDESPNTVPPTSEEELVTGKEIGRLGEGIHYAHVQFKNNRGWGETAHYRIAIDITPPQPFSLELSSAASENPRPRISFDTQDALSGFSHAEIFIDENDPLRATSTSLQLPPQVPGNHRVLVRVFDAAGNAREASAEFEVLPIETPVIEFLPAALEQGEALFVSGSALPGISVNVVVTDEDGVQRWSGMTESDDSGHWQLTADETFPTGEYTVRAVARDERGAQSYPTEGDTFDVRAATVFSIGGIALGWLEILVFVVLLVVAALGTGAWWYREQQVTRAAYQTVLGRDIKKMATLMNKEVDRLERWREKEGNKFSPQALEESRHSLEKLRDLIDKTKRYLAKEVDSTK